MTNQIDIFLKRAIDEHIAISFDVFDTLLIRKVAEPHDVFKIMEYKLEDKGFAQRRINAEAEARKKTCREEVTLLEIYAEGQIDPNLMSIEMDIEKEVLCLNPNIKPLFDYCKEKKRRIFIISDMYLPTEFIKGILNREGYTGWEQLYVSSKYGLTKGSGSLFEKFLKENNLNGCDVFHIGDSPWSDAKKPLEKGIKSYLYQQSLTTLLDIDNRIKKQYEESNELATHLILGLVHAKYQSLKPVGRFIKSEKDLKDTSRQDIKAFIPKIFKEEEYWTKFGYCFAGPAVVGFIGWIANQVKKLEVEQVLFVGRDGYVLSKIFEKYYPKISIKYIWAPRAVRAACAARDALQSDTSIFTITDLVTLVDSFIARDWLPRTWQAPVIVDDVERRKFLRNEIYKVKEHVDIVIEEYKSYLQKTDIFTIKAKTAVVDSCSINLSSQKLLSEFLPVNKLEGLYWVIPEGYSSKDLEFFSTHTFQMKKRHEIITWNLMEWIMTAPYPGINYIDGEKLVFNQVHPNEKVRNDIYPIMEKGILSFASDFYNTYNDFYLLSSAKSIVSWINQFCMFPTTDDRSYFSKIKHASDAASKQWEDCMQNWTENESFEKKGNNKGVKFFKKIRMGENIYFKIGPIKILRIKNRSVRKRWYLFGIPLLERRSEVDGYAFYILKIIPLCKVKK